MRRVVLVLLLSGCASDGTLSTKIEFEGPDGTTGTTGTTAAEVDADGDGFTVENGDCDDTKADINPSATEVCDGIDNNCNDAVDDADDSLDRSTMGTWYADADTDSFGNPDAAISACAQPSGTVDDNTDCDDGDAAVNPDATEVCNGYDDNCDGAVDDDDANLDLSTASTWYADTDTDTYGDPSSSVQACIQPSGTVTDSSDCDDGDGDVNPAATEVCNGYDDDCDTDVDDDDTSLDTSTASTFYTDFDLDTYGDPDAPVLACVQPSGTVLDDTDCDDTDGSVYPGAPEIPDDGIDNDCDPTTPDSTGGGTFDSTDASVVIEGVTAYEGIGNMIVSGDFNGDGDDDLATGAGSVGTAYAIFGPLTANTDVSAADASITGLYNGSVSYLPLAADDVDGDGIDDLYAAGAYSHEAYLFYGPFSGALTASGSADASISTSSLTYLGTSMKLYDDVTGDGDPDILIGAPLVSGSASYGGAAYIFDADQTGTFTTSNATVTIYGSYTQEWLGGASTSGDVNGDGLEDVVVAGHYYTYGGDVYTFFGPVSGTLATSGADVTITTPSTTDLFGNSIGSGFDQDGDGYDDIIVGAAYDSAGGTGSGAAYVFNGAATGFTTSKSAADAIVVGGSGDYVGFEVAAIDDYNGDGHGDAWVSAYYGNTNGAATMFLGPMSGTQTINDAFIYIDSNYQARHIGSAYAEVDDVDGDGRPDFWIGAPGESSSSASTVGKIFLFESTNL